jgi:hypothetical protein
MKEQRDANARKGDMGERVGRERHPPHHREGSHEPRGGRHRKPQDERAKFFLRHGHGA